ncbi:hypothetical protein ACFQY0_15650 [Haloferula chungangensis]|uniref:Transporter n=1 Tax=Haloferula chungangensis TaxID=1048331 RepID=A0ABW2LAM9_9BACT
MKIIFPIVPLLGLATFGVTSAETSRDTPGELTVDVVEETESPSSLDANEIAQKLANPNTPLATLTLRNQWIRWGGDLPGADGLESGVFEFQPVFPFPIDDITTVSFRPAFSYLVDQPYYDAASGRVESRSGFSDMGFDLGYGVTTESGFLARVGMSGSVPIGAEHLSSETWALGPEFLVGYKNEHGLFGFFPSHLWDISGPATINRTTLQPLVVFLPGKAWAFGSSPIISYNWEAEEWTLPLQLFASKTVKFGEVPVRLGLEMNYFLDQPDGLGEEWMIAFNFTPVFPNIFAQWFSGSD